MANIADFWSKKPESVIKASISGRRTCLTTVEVCLNPWMRPLEGGKGAVGFNGFPLQHQNCCVKRRAKNLLLALARIHLFGVKSAPKFVSILLRHECGLREALKHSIQCLDGLLPLVEVMIIS